jgi:hypothetical protein
MRVNGKRVTNPQQPHCKARGRDLAQGRLQAASDRARGRTSLPERERARIQSKVDHNKVTAKYVRRPAFADVPIPGPHGAGPGGRVLLALNARARAGPGKQKRAANGCLFCLVSQP